MIILLEILGSIITILYLVDKFSQKGVNAGRLNLNPFAWYRSRKWQNKYHADPAFSLDRPMEAVAGLLYVMAKCSGEITREQKECIIEIFETEFRLDERQAVELLTSSSFLLKDEDHIVENLKSFLKPSLAKFDAEKRQSTLDLLQKVADCEGKRTSKQDEFLNKVSPFFQQIPEPERKW
jgi:uncharacterized tellurite resistance protein B-like protein